MSNTNTTKSAKSASRSASARDARLRALREHLTTLIQQAQHGEGPARTDAYEVLYADLHPQAVRQLRNEAPSPFLQPTILINEVFLEIIKAEHVWRDRKAFFSVAADVIRHFLVDHARIRDAIKRNGGIAPEQLPDDYPAPEVEPDQLLDMIAIDEALHQLQTEDNQAYDIFRMRFFAGRTFKDLAAIFELDAKLVERKFQLARGFVRSRLNGKAESP